MEGDENVDKLDDSVNAGNLMRGQREGRQVLNNIYVYIRAFYWRDHLDRRENKNFVKEDFEKRHESITYETLNATDHELRVSLESIARNFHRKNGWNVIRGKQQTRRYEIE